MLQYVYKLSASDLTEKLTSSSDYHIIATCSDWWKWLFPIRHVLGNLATFKLILKWLAGKKTMYFFASDRQIQSYGIISFGYCKLYTIEPTAAVIGPVNTLPASQGRGLATKTLQFAATWLFHERNGSAVYIDTAENNLRMQRVIEKVGFIGPIQSFPRG